MAQPKQIEIMRAININVLQRIKYDMESYKKNAEEVKKSDPMSCNFWKGKEQALREIVDMLECNIVEEHDLWKL
jgi:hypothetical protein